MRLHMKNIIIYISLLIPSSNLSAQILCDFFDDYSDPAPWTNVYIYPGIAPCSLDPQTGTLEVTGGEVVFTNVNDGNDTRIHRDLGFTLSDDAWTANFDFKSTDMDQHEVLIERDEQ